MLSQGTVALFKPSTIDPGETEEHYQQGISYERKGDYENAIVSYQKAIEINPENAAAYNALAWLYADQLETNLDDAIILAQTAVTLTQGKEDSLRDYWLANYLDTLGWAYYKSGNYTEAVATLERAVALNDRKSFSVHLEVVRTALNSSHDVEP
jgi:tetratricopeptide (TPR) repeat protein